MDAWLLRLVAELRTPALTRVMSFVSEATRPAYVFRAAVLVTLFLAVRRRGAPAARGRLLAMWALTYWTTLFVKELVDAPRPAAAFAIAEARGNGFPSGHASLAFAMFTLAALGVSFGRGRRVRRLALGVALAAALTVGFSRVYLGVHFVSDVVGGYAVGGFWLYVLTRARRDVRAGLERLRLARRRVRVVQQLEQRDCGAACLAMVLSAFGRDVDLEEARERTRTSMNGVTALDIARGARGYGLEATPARVRGPLPRRVPTPAVLHWQDDHFVVLERAGRRLHLVDPRRGRFVLSRAKVAEFHRSGVLVSFDATDEFERLAAPARSRFRHVRRYVAPLRLFWYGAVAAAVAVQIAVIVAALLTRTIVDDPSRPSAAPLVVAYAVTLLCQVGVDAIRTFTLGIARDRVSERFFGDVVEHLFRLPYEFFARRSVGDLLARVSSGDVIEQLVSAATIGAVVDASFASVVLLALLVISPQAGLVVTACVLMYLAASFTVRRRYAAATTALLEQRARTSGVLLPAMSAYETTLLIGPERALSRWRTNRATELEMRRAQTKLASTSVSVEGFFNRLAQVTVFAISGFALVGGRIGVGDFVLRLTLTTAVVNPLLTLPRRYLQIEEARAYLDRINDVLDRAPRSRPDPENRPWSGAIEVTGASYAYDLRSEPAVRDVSFTVAPGQRVAIVGESGSGKTTLIRLLTGLCEPTSGSVTAVLDDGTRVPMSAVAHRLGVVPQDIELFGGTIAENIDASPEVVARAAAMVGLKDKIEGMEFGYASHLSEEGAGLSGGERQRIAIARALAREPDVVVLDESTSALDAASEERVVSALAGRTVVLASHRMAAVREADEVIVLVRGKIVARGPYDELLRTSPELRRMVGGAAAAPDSFAAMTE